MAHCSTLLKGLLLEQGEVLKQGFQPVSVQLSSMGEVTRCGQHLFIDCKDLVQCSLIDVQCWERCTQHTSISRPTPDSHFHKGIGLPMTLNMMLLVHWRHLWNHGMAATADRQQL